MIARAAAAILLAASAPAGAALSQDELAVAVARPPAAARLPGDLTFTDVAGRRATLGAIAAGRPLVLLFADYTCAHMCAPGLALTANALARSGLAAGRDYRVAVIGLDPKDGAGAARAMTAGMLADPAVRRVTTVLLGDVRATAAAARALGYGYAYDAGSDQFAHDASVYVFAADGRLSATLPELGLMPATVKAALAGAVQADAAQAGAAERPGLADRVAHLCYGFAAAHGRYGRPIVIGLQASSALLLLGFGAFLLRRWRGA
ncbi:SCO family protein [Sphingomonas profundi]|uniref:SCO family protein n=1 Tax=Alterirhizorhabdus profundi TaxID=2681549 RepID=UPI0012E983FE|nr:SCO family protein [Sphingomonas profundi]